MFVRRQGAFVRAMATYKFSTITAQQALAYAATDSVDFDTSGFSAAQVSVIFIPGDVTTPETVSITIGNKTVVFGTPIEGEIDLKFTDGSLIFIGTAGSDASPVAGGANNDAFFGNAGNDSFVGGAGNDLLQGNGGDDTMAGDSGADTLYGGQGNDHLRTGDGKNFAQGNLGNDSLTGGSEADSLYGGKGNDTIQGGGGGDYLNGNLGDDSVAGGVGSDSITGEDGADTLSGGAWSSGLPNGGRDYLTGGAGADRFVFAVGDSSPLAGNGDQILDWAADDFISFGGAVGTAPTYSEGTAASYAEAVGFANGAISGGTVNYVAVQVGSDVVVFADAPAASNGSADIAVVLVGRTLADIDFGDIV